jgi:acyl-CoA synthetase (NDP forming)
VEVWRDVRFGVTPLSPSEAREMIEGIRGYELLKGVRGERGADIRVLIEVLLRIAQLASRHPRITELDINPFIAAPDRQRALALDARLRVGPPDPADLGSEP